MVYTQCVIVSVRTHTHTMRKSTTQLDTTNYTTSTVV